MRFFDVTAMSPTDTEPRPERIRPVWMRPEAVLPITVGVDLVLAHTDAAAIALSGLWCYPSGFEFSVQAVLREPDRRGNVFTHTHQMIEAGEPIPPEMLRMGLQFGDGTKVTNLPGQFHHREPAEADRPILFPISGGGDNRSRRQKYWVWPLPPPGPLTFVCEWPHFQIGETRATIDAQVVLDAAARAVTLWPEP